MASHPACGKVARDFPTVAWRWGLPAIRSILLPAASAALLVLASPPPASGQNPTHPLDPLTAEEIRLVVSALEDDEFVHPETRFGLVELREPSKQQVREDLASRVFRRDAYVQAYDWSSSTSAEAIVDLDGGRVLSWTQLESREPTTFFLVFDRVAEIVRADARWGEAMRRRGISDEEGIRMAPDGIEFGRPLFEGREPGDVVIPVASWVNNADSQDAEELYLDIEVNLNRGVVTRFEDRLPAEVPAGRSYYDVAGMRPLRRPLSIEQGDGPGFTMNGSKLTWQKWEMSFGVHPRRGLELYDVAWRDADRRRTILYRASISEMVAPYGDPGWISFYPADEGGRGMALSGSLRSAEVGEDTPPNAVYRSAVSHDGHGNPIVIDRAVSIYERDDGLLWRHHDEARRARALVLTSFHTVDNYDYQLSWIFREDGTIEVEALLTGMINWYPVDRPRDTGDRLAGAPASHVLVAPGVAGPIHQHFFSYRLDFDVDGTENSVVEMNTVTTPTEGPDGSDEWFATKGGVLDTELGARRSVDPASGRWWRVVNPGIETSLGQPPGYALLPGHNAFPYGGPDSPARRTFGFLDAHLWVTPFDPSEMYAAGRFLSFDRFGEGLPRWVQADRGVENEDVVVWYTLGLTHLPRPEDWPIMPARRESFRLVPFGFFTANPSMGVSRPHPWR
jgi:primary-amine oxidase